MITDEQVVAIEALGQKYPGHPMAKFCVDPMRWDREAEAIADELDLGIEMLNVLDIGCGFGYFVNVCSGRGCIAYGLDVPDSCIVAATAALLVPVVWHTVRHNEPLPGLCDGPYDLITMFGVNLRSELQYWVADDYAWLTRYICRRIMSGGRFVVHPNLPHTWDVDCWIELIGDIATVERTETTITVRPK